MRKTAGKRRRMSGQQDSFAVVTAERLPKPPLESIVAPVPPSAPRPPIKIRVRPILKALTAHPVLWGIAGAIISYLWARSLPSVNWNAVEMMIGKNLLLGRGFVVAPFDPPALWRPPLGPLVCALVELFTRDPFLIYVIIYASALTTFTICAFYVSKSLWGLKAAHLASFLVLTSPALTFRLVTHLHSISHVVFLIVIGPALLATLAVIAKPAPRRFALAGFCWALCYLARWETLLFFFVSLGAVLCSLYMKNVGRRAALNVVFMVAAFLAVFLPYKLFEKHVMTQYGVWGPSALTTFYASEAWVFGNGNESTGYADGVRKYGTLESNGNSLLRAISRNPAALLARLRVNIPRFVELFKNRDYFDPWWLVFLPLLVAAVVRRPKSAFFPAYFVVLFLCTTTVCLFHIDSRYLTIGLPSLFLLLCGGFALFWDAFIAQRPIWVKVLCVAGIVFLGWRAASSSLESLTASLNRSPGRPVDEELARSMAMKFRGAVHDTRTWTLSTVLPSDAKYTLLGLDLMVSYFADTAIEWYHYPGFPSDKLFSYRYKNPDYKYIPEEYLYKSDLLLNHTPLATVNGGVDGSFYLFQAPIPQVTNIEALNSSQRARLLFLLKEQYPGLIKTYLQYAGLLLSKATLLAVNEPSAHRVGCGVLALNGAPLTGGRSNRVFDLDLTIPEESIKAFDGNSIPYIELVRSEPWGIFHTSKLNYILGVSRAPDGPLLNQSDGGVEIPLEPRIQLRLYACDDGANRPASAYQARVKVGRSQWISTAAPRP